MTLMFTHGGEGPSLRRSINPKRALQIQKKNFSPNNSQSNRDYIRSGADTPISDSVRQRASRDAATSFSRAFVSAASSVTTRHLS